MSETPRTELHLIVEEVVEEGGVLDDEGSDG